MSTSLLVSAQRLYRTKEKNIASMHIEVVIPDAGKSIRRVPIQQNAARETE